MAFIRGARELVLRLHPGTQQEALRRPLRRGVVGVLAAVLAVVSAGAQDHIPGVDAPAPPAAPPASLAALSSAPAYQGLRVTEVEFRGITADRPVMDNLRQLVAQNLNQPLDRQ